MAEIRKDAKDRINQYITELPDFSKKICMKLRTLILSADSGIQEDWKWGPNYNFRGMICGFGAFRKHVKFTFFNGYLMKDRKKLFNHCVDNEKSRSIKFTDVSEINDAAIIEYLIESVKLNQRGIPREKQPKTLELNEDLIKLLKTSKSLKKNFDAMPYYKRKDYNEWISTAKRPETKADRLQKFSEKVKLGLGLNDQYR